jgi:hypothetical protein
VTGQGAIPHPREVEADHYPLSLRILTLKDILDKRATPTSCRSCGTSSPRAGAASLDDTPRRNRIVKFATDSLLQGCGFEPSVPVAREPVYIAEGELGDRRGSQKKFCGGTNGSNQSPSSSESAANPMSVSLRDWAIVTPRLPAEAAEAADRHLYFS